MSAGREGRGEEFSSGARSDGVFLAFRLDAFGKVLGRPSGIASPLRGVDSPRPKVAFTGRQLAPEFLPQ